METQTFPRHFPRGAASRAVLFLLTWATLAAGGPAAAATVYQYTGYPFTLIRDQNPPAGTYTTAMQVTGEFSIASSVAAGSLIDVSDLVLSYDFFDGRQRLTRANSSILEFKLAVGGDGRITEWGISVGSLGSSLIDTYRYRDGNLDVWADGGSMRVGNTFDGGFVFGSPGTWTVVPAPGGAWLLATGVLGLLARLRRRSRPPTPPSSYPRPATPAAPAPSTPGTPC